MTPRLALAARVTPRLALAARVTPRLAAWWRAALGVSVVLAVLGRAGAASAEPCNRPDVEATFPRNGAVGVPPNARLHARYAASAEYLGEDVTLEREGEPAEIGLTWESAETRLTAVPSQPLVAGDEYRIVWPSLRGLATATPGNTRTVRFTAGSVDDTEPPVFEGLTDIDWDLTRDQDECTDQQEDRLRFRLSVGEVSDDGGRDSLQLVVFQTRGPTISATGDPEPLDVVPLPRDGKVEITLPPSRASGHVCFAALTRDLVDHASGGAEREVCADPEEPPFFKGCSVTERAPSTPGAAAWLVLACLALARIRRG